MLNKDYIDLVEMVEKEYEKRYNQIENIIQNHLNDIGSDIFEKAFIYEAGKSVTFDFKDDNTRTLYISICRFYFRNKKNYDEKMLRDLSHVDILANHSLKNIFNDLRFRIKNKYNLDLSDIIVGVEGDITKGSCIVLYMKIPNMKVTKVSNEGGIVAKYENLDKDMKYYCTEYTYQHLVKELKQRYFPFYDAFNEWIMEDIDGKEFPNYYEPIPYDNPYVEESIENYLDLSNYYKLKEKNDNFGRSLILTFATKDPKRLKKKIQDNIPDYEERIKKYTERVVDFIYRYFQTKVLDKYGIVSLVNDTDKVEKSDINIDFGSFCIVEQDDKRINCIIDPNNLKEEIKLSGEAMVTLGKHEINISNSIKNDQKRMKWVKKYLDVWKKLDDYNYNALKELITNCETTDDLDRLLGELVPITLVPRKEFSKSKIRKLLLDEDLITMERFTLPFKHINKDGSPVVSRCEMFMLPVMIRGLRQMSNKEGKSASDSSVKNTTGQSTGESRSGTYSDTELTTSISQGMDKIVKEFMGPASSNHRAKQFLNTQIRETGHASMKGMPDNPEDKKTLMYINEYAKFAGILLDLTVDAKDIDKYK